MMRMIDIQEAKIRLSELIDHVNQGNEILITVAGKPVALLGSVTKNQKRRFGVFKGKIKISKDFDAPLSEDFSYEHETA